jgi:hypothetical protein
LEERQIHFFVGTDNPRSKLSFVEKGNFDFACVLDNVIVGQNVTVFVDDES